MTQVRGFFHLTAHAPSGRTAFPWACTRWLEDRLGLGLVEQAEDGRYADVNDGEDAEDHCPMGGDEGHGGVCVKG